MCPLLVPKREILVVQEHKCNQDISWICDFLSFPLTDHYIDKFYFSDCEWQYYSLEPPGTD